MPVITASRYHDISCGHRVAGHESKCRGLHGHNYRFTFYCSAPDLDNIGRVLDFGAIKTKLCEWVEHAWDHRFLLWDQDPILEALCNADEYDSVVAVPFNPTAENMAKYLLTVVGPLRLAGTSVTLARVVVSETRKCSAAAALS